MPKPTKFKVLRNTARAIRKGIDLGTETEKRVTKALDKIAAETYSTADLADDILGQSADFLGALTGVVGESTDVRTLYLITNGPSPVGSISFPQKVTGAQIDKGILAGPITVAGGQNPNAQVVTVNSIAPGDYRLLHPYSGQPLVANDEYDGVQVEINNVPAQAGVYRGVLTLQSTDVLAEIVVVRK
jgi:hypothetical protein